MVSSSDASFSRSFPRTTSPLITLLQKKRAVNNVDPPVNNVDPPVNNVDLPVNNVDPPVNNVDPPKTPGKPLKYTFNFSLSNSTKESANSTIMKETPSDTKTTEPSITTPASQTTTNKIPATKTTAQTTKPTTNFPPRTTSNNSIRYTPNHFGMDHIRENIVESSTKADSRDWTTPDAAYNLQRFHNRPRSIEFYEPGSSSLSKNCQNSTFDRMTPLDKPGDLCRYIVSPPSQRYKLKKRDHDDDIPPLRPPTPHHVYMNVHKGGDVPLGGLYCPPFLKPDLNISTRKSRWYKDMLNKMEKPSNKIYTTPCLPLPPNPSKNRQNFKVSSKEKISLCELLASTNMSCKDRRSRDEINEARKVQMELYIKSAKLKKKIEEEQENENRRHSDYCYGLFCKSPVTLDRYNLEDDAFSSPKSSPIPPRPQSPYPSYKARVLYNFHAKNSRELTLEKGDVVLVWGVVDENWMKGEHHGNVGIFPSCYVEIYQSFDLPQSFSFGHLYCLLYNFQAASPEEITLKKGDIVRVVQRINNDWLKVELIKSVLVRNRSPETSFFSTSPNNVSEHRFSKASHNANSCERNLHSNDHKTGLIPASYLIPLERNIDTIQAFQIHSPNQVKMRDEFPSANKPTNPALNKSWKDIPQVLVGKKGLFVTEEFNHSKINGRHLNKPNLNIKKDDLNINKSNLLRNGTYNQTNRNNKLVQEDNYANYFANNHQNNYRNTKDEYANDLYIDEDYLNDLDTLTASIDPLFYLNLSKFKPHSYMSGTPKDKFSKIV